jgi:hypothetical protein
MKKKNKDELISLLQTILYEAEDKKEVAEHYDLNMNKYGISFIIEQIYEQTENENEALQLLKLLQTDYKTVIIRVKNPCIECTEKITYYEYLKENHKEILKLDKPWLRWDQNEYDSEAMEKYNNEYNKYKQEYEDYIKELCIDCKENMKNVELLEYNLSMIENQIQRLNETATGSEQEATPETATQPAKVILKRGRPKVREYEQKIIAFEVLETAIKDRIEKNYPVRSLSNYYTLLKYCKKYFNKNLSELKIEDIEQEKAKLKRKAKSKNDKQ